MSADRSQLEDVFWQIMRGFEVLALRQYERHVPPIATAAKRALVGRLVERAPDDTALEASELAAPVRALLAGAAGADDLHTLIVQGLVLEHLGEAIYAAVDHNGNVTQSTRALATLARTASRSVAERVPALLSARCSDGERVFAAFAEASHDVLLGLDPVGEGVDRVFGEPFALHFKDIAGDFVARLIPVCTTLGMTRRKVVSHLAGSFMGL